MGVGDLVAGAGAKAKSIAEGEFGRPVCIGSDGGVGGFGELEVAPEVGAVNIEHVGGGEAPVFFGLGFVFDIGPVDDLDGPEHLHEIESVDVADFRGGAGMTDLGEGGPRECSAKLPAFGFGLGIVNRAVGDEFELDIGDFERIIAGAAADIGAIHAHIKSDADGVDLPF